MIKYENLILKVFKINRSTQPISNYLKDSTPEEIKYQRKDEVIEQFKHVNPTLSFDISFPNSEIMLPEKSASMKFISIDWSGKE
jgi:hypothetical protein